MYVNFKGLINATRSNLCLFYSFVIMVCIISISVRLFQYRRTTIFTSQYYKTCYIYRSISRHNNQLSTVEDAILLGMISVYQSMGLQVVLNLIGSYECTTIPCLQKLSNRISTGEINWGKVSIVPFASVPLAETIHSSVTIGNLATPPVIGQGKHHNMYYYIHDPTLGLPNNELLRLPLLYSYDTVLVDSNTAMKHFINSNLPALVSSLEMKDTDIRLFPNVKIAFEFYKPNW